MALASVMVMLPCCVQISPLSSINPSSMLIREIEYSPGLLSARMASRPSVETWPYFALHVRMALSMAAVALVGCDRLVSVDSSDGSSSLSAASADCGRCAAWQNSSISVSDQMMEAWPSCMSRLHPVL